MTDKEIEKEAENYTASIYIQSPSDCDDEYGYVCEYEQNIEDAFKNGATAICKKILKEVRTNEGIEQMTKFYIGEIIKNLGVDINETLA